MKDELGGRMMKEFVGLRAKTYSYLKDNNDENKKAKGTKNCLEGAQIENKINHLEKNKIDADSLKEDQKEFIKNNKRILKKRKELEVKNVMFLLKKLIRLL